MEAVMAAKAKGEKGLAQRVGRIERELKEMRATAPPRPEDTVQYLKEQPQFRDHRSSVDERLAALRGVSRRGLEADAERGASSPLGHGTGSQPMKRGRRR